MYQALYRKWRPRSFDDVCGQEHVTDALKRQIQSGRHSHAYLFVGIRGTGKTTCAKILSRAVNCENPQDGNPCNVCPSCVGIENGSVLDVLEIDAASNNGVDNVRALREEAVFTPASVKKRVYIIDEVHMLSTAAFNALLKILEEPPEHLVFILATTDVHKIPATILSRCQRFSLRRIGAEVIAQRLGHIAGEEGITISADAAELLARRADGSMRDALSLLDRCAALGEVDISRVQSAIGLSSAAETEQLLAACAERDVSRALQILSALYAEGKSMTAVIDELIELERDVLISIITRGATSSLSGSFSSEAVSRLALKCTPEKLISDIDILRSGAQRITKNESGRLAVELCLIQMCNESLSESYSAINSRLSELERRIDAGIPANKQPPSTTPAAVPEAPAAPIPEPPPPAAAPMQDAPPWDDEPEALTPEAQEADTQETQPPEERFDAPPPMDDELPFPVTTQDDSAPDAWQQILSALEGELEFHIYSILSDSAHCTAEIDGSGLIIRAKNGFALNIIGAADITHAIKQAADKVLGRAVTIKVTQETAGAAAASSKLDELSKFGNIKFE